MTTASRLHRKGWQRCNPVREQVVLRYHAGGKVTVEIGLRSEDQQHFSRLPLCLPPEYPYELESTDFLTPGGYQEVREVLIHEYRQRVYPNYWAVLFAPLILLLLFAIIPGWQRRCYRHAAGPGCGFIWLPMLALIILVLQVYPWYQRRTFARKANKHVLKLLGRKYDCHLELTLGFWAYWPDSLKLVVGAFRDAPHRYVPDTRKFSRIRGLSSKRRNSQSSRASRRSGTSGHSRRSGRSRGSRSFGSRRESLESGLSDRDVMDPFRQATARLPPVPSHPLRPQPSGHEWQVVAVVPPSDAPKQRAGSQRSGSRSNRKGSKRKGGSLFWRSKSAATRTGIGKEPTTSVDDQLASGAGSRGSGRRGGSVREWMRPLLSKEEQEKARQDSDEQ